MTPNNNEAKTNMEQIYQTRNSNESICNFEMNRSELKHFIRLLESIQTVRENLKKKFLFIYCQLN